MNENKRKPQIEMKKKQKNKMFEKYSEWGVKGMLLW